MVCQKSAAKAKSNKSLRESGLVMEGSFDKAVCDKVWLMEVFRKWAREKAATGEIIFNENNCTKKYTKYTRFTTKAMSEIFRDAPKASSRWKTKNYYSYEIANCGGKKFAILLAFNLNEDTPEEIKRLYREMGKCECVNKSKGDEGWQFWTRVFKNEYVQPAETDKEIFMQLDRLYKNVMALEAKLLEELKNL